MLIYNDLSILKIPESVKIIDGRCKFFYIAVTKTLRDSKTTDGFIPSNPSAKY
jgi:hypothetical protein